LSRIATTHSCALTLHPLPQAEEDAKRPVMVIKMPPLRIWIATALVIVVVVAVWKFIDWRTQPPPPPHPVVAPTPP
jgi:hypothetical protein